MGIVVVGSIAFDSIETPFGKVGKILGGSANYFSIAASQFTPVQCVSVVGQDLPAAHLDLLQSRGVDISGIQRESGQTFHWAGKYGYDLHEATTLSTHLNVFEHFNPKVPAAFKDTPFVFLANVAPHLQSQVVTQITGAKFIAIDTMNFWIEGARDALIQAIGRTHALIINEGEVRQLTRTYNVVQAAKIIQGWGPKILVVKRGEYGAILFHGESIFSLPGLPLSEVKDPTGAGDTFAGGFMGYLASRGDTNPSLGALKKAVAYGCVLASFTVEDFGFQELLKVNKPKLEDRYARFVELTSFHNV